MNQFALNNQSESALQRRDRLFSQKPHSAMKKNDSFSGSRPAPSVTFGDLLRVEQIEQKLISREQVDKTFTEFNDYYNQSFGNSESLFSVEQSSNEYLQSQYQTDYGFNSYDSQNSMNSVSSSNEDSRVNSDEYSRSHLDEYSRVNSDEGRNHSSDYSSLNNQKASHSSTDNLSANNKGDVDSATLNQRDETARGDINKVDGAAKKVGSGEAEAKSAENGSKKSVDNRNATTKNKQALSADLSAFKAMDNGKKAGTSEKSFKELTTTEKSKLAKSGIKHLSSHDEKIKASTDAVVKSDGEKGAAAKKLSTSADKAAASIKEKSTAGEKSVPLNLKNGEAKELVETAGSTGAANKKGNDLKGLSSELRDTKAVNAAAAKVKAYRVKSSSSAQNGSQNGLDNSGSETKSPVVSESLYLNDLKNETSATAIESRFSRYLKEGGLDKIVKQAKIILKDNNNGEIKLILKPEKLGSVKINLNIKDNHIVGKIFVENNSIREAFKDSLAELNRALTENGFDSAAVDVSLSNDQSGKESGFEKAQRLAEMQGAGESSPSATSEATGFYGVSESNSVDLVL